MSEPRPTWIARVLRPGGVFAAYQYTSIVTGRWEADAAWEDLRALVRRRAARGSGSTTTGSGGR